MKGGRSTDLSTPGARPPASGPALDDESTAWTTALSSEGCQREDARTRLHAFLLRAARFEVRRRARTDGAEGDTALEDLASAAADAALTAIERDLHAYRGQSRFTTWAAKFALYEAGVRFRIHAWRHQSIPPESEGLAQLVRSPGDGEVDAQLCRAREVFAENLTAHQRFVIAALALNEVPIDVVAERLGTTRGALYETLREARLAVRSKLSETLLARGP